MSLEDEHVEDEHAEHVPLADAPEPAPRPLSGPDPRRPWTVIAVGDGHGPARRGGARVEGGPRREPGPARRRPAPRLGGRGAGDHLPRRAAPTSGRSSPGSRRAWARSSSRRTWTPCSSDRATRSRAARSSRRSTARTRPPRRQAIAMQARAVDEQQRALDGRGGARRGAARRRLRRAERGRADDREERRGAGRSSSRRRPSSPPPRSTCSDCVLRAPFDGRDRLALRSTPARSSAPARDRLRRRSRRPSGSPPRRPRRTSSCSRPRTVVQIDVLATGQTLTAKIVAASAQGRPAHAHGPLRDRRARPRAHDARRDDRHRAARGRRAAPRGGDARLRRDGPQRQGQALRRRGRHGARARRCRSWARAAGGSTSTPRRCRPTRASSPRGAPSCRTATPSRRSRSRPIAPPDGVRRAARRRVREAAVTGLSLRNPLASLTLGIALMVFAARAHPADERRHLPRPHPARARRRDARPRARREGRGEDAHLAHREVRERHARRRARAEHLAQQPEHRLRLAELGDGSQLARRRSSSSRWRSRCRPCPSRSA